MPRFLKEKPWFALSVITIFTIALCGACKDQKSAALPYIPPAYFDCLEAKGSDLAISYFSNYGNMARSELLYNNRYFVFKNQLVEGWMITELDKGWIWIEGNIKCVLLNASSMKAFKIGDKIDVVGYNTGVIKGLQGLLFKDCIVMAAGTVQLPLEGGAATISLY